MIPSGGAPGLITAIAMFRRLAGSAYFWVLCCSGRPATLQKYGWARRACCRCIWIRGPVRPAPPPNRTVAGTGSSRIENQQHRCRGWLCTRSTMGCTHRATRETCTVPHRRHVCVSVSAVWRGCTRCSCVTNVSRVPRCAFSECRSEGVEWVHMDLTDEDQVKSVVARLKPAVVVNCAAMASLGRCEKVPDQAASINAVGDAAAAACRCHCVSLTKHYGFAPACVSAQGAQSVIADSTGRPHVHRLRVWPGHVGLLCGGSCHRCTDNSVCAPNQLVSCRTPTHIGGLGRYGCTKAKFEAELGASWPRHVILRSSNIIGPPPPIASLPGQKFLQWLHGALTGSGTWRRQRGVLCKGVQLCSCVAAADVVQVFSDERRRFVYVEDVARAICHFTLHALSSSGTQPSTPATYHLGGPVLWSREDVAAAVRPLTSG